MNGVGGANCVIVGPVIRIDKCDAQARRHQAIHGSDEQIFVPDRRVGIVVTGGAVAIDNQDRIGPAIFAIDTHVPQASVKNLSVLNFHNPLR